MEIFTSLTSKSPYTIQFHYEEKIIQTNLTFPLVDDDMIGISGTPLQSFQTWLCMQCQVQDVIGFVTMEAEYGPCLPLLFLNSIAHASDQSNMLMCRIITQSTHMQDNDDNLLNNPCILLNRMEMHDILLHGKSLVHNLQHYGYTKIVISNTLSQKIQHLHTCMNMYLVQNNLQWKENISQKQNGRFVGLTHDKNRRWLQMRKPVGDTLWPPVSFPALKEEMHSLVGQLSIQDVQSLKKSNESFPEFILDVFNELDAIAVQCYQSICQELDIYKNGMNLLDEYYSKKIPIPIIPCLNNNEEKETSNTCSDRYGASVLRLYRYAATKEAAPSSPSCGLVRT